MQTGFRVVRVRLDRREGDLALSKPMSASNPGVTWLDQFLNSRDGVFCRHLLQRRELDNYIQPRLQTFQPLLVGERLLMFP